MFSKIKLFTYIAFLTFQAWSFTPLCERKNQFKFYCFPIEACAPYNLDLCRFDRCGVFSGKMKIVKILNTRVLPTCAFDSSSGLEHIYGVNSNIEVLATRAFRNLVDLKSIQLAFNLIKEVKKGIFDNVTVETLDLSWNKIIYMDKDGLGGINGLKYLNLSKNELLTIPLATLPSTIVNLNLSYNLLDRALLNSYRYTNLTVVNLSNNLIEKLAISSEHPMEELDLSNNQLDRFDFIDIDSIKVLRINSNYFVNIPEELLELSITTLDIYPNPWNCNQLRNAWTHFHINGVQIVKKRLRVLCGEFPHLKLLPQLLWEPSTEITYYEGMKCTEDYHCPSSMVCRGATCSNPCENPMLCDETSDCTTHKRRFQCFCPHGYLRDPLDIYSACNRVECYSSTDCAYQYTCVENKCHKSAFSPVDPQLIPQPTSTTAEEEPWWFDEIPKYNPIKNRQ